MTPSQQVSYLYEWVGHPACLKCGQPMRLLLVGEKYQGTAGKRSGANRATAS